MSLKNIRDLLAGPAHPSESVGIRDVAKNTAQAAQMGPSAEQQQRDPSSNFVAKMPGDDGTHPLAETGRNPFPGWSVLAISRALRDGRITDPTLERKARAYLSQYQRLTGEVFYDGRMHNPEHPTEQQYADENTVSPDQSGRLHRADPFNSGRSFRFGGPKVR